jgi:c-di-GMP-binding flagellar brake protein YcgR
MSDGSERRQFLRVESTVPVMYWLSPTGDVPPLRSLTKNIGGGGVCLYLSQPLLPGTRLQVQMRLPEDGRSFPFTAEVAWCDAPKAGGAAGPSVMAGLRFIEIAPEDQQAIIRYCLSRVPPSAPPADRAA